MRGNKASMTRLPELADQVIRRNVSDELEKLKKAPPGNVNPAEAPRPSSNMRSSVSCWCG